MMLTQISSLKVSFVFVLLLLSFTNLKAQDQDESKRMPLALTSADGRDLGLSRRLVTKPDARVIKELEKTDSVVSYPRPFSTFYIFDIKEKDEIKYFEVGPPGEDPIGWISENESLEWRNNVSLVFSPPLTRDPTLFFRSLPSLVNQAGDPEKGDAVLHSLADSIKETGKSLGTGVIAMEGGKEEFVSWRDKFYLMPVLDFVNRPRNKVDKRHRLYLKTAAVPLNSASSTDSSCGEERNVGIVFVVDSTKSMQPYLERTLQAVQNLAKKIQEDTIGERVNFGLVAFRDDPTNRPGVEYRTKVFQNLTTESDPLEFDQVVSKVHATDASTKGFSEDALAGVLSALDMEWDSFQSRWIILVTDASPRETTEDNNGSSASIDGVAVRTTDQIGAGLIAIHLKTPEAIKAGDARKAKARLTALASWENVANGYYEVENGDVNVFGDVIDGVAGDMLTQINKSLEELESEIGSGDAIADIGLAQRLIWLGKCDKEAPSILEGWIVDHSIIPHESKGSFEKYAVQPRLLLTRIQLDQFRKAVQSVLDAAVAAPEATGDVFFTAIAEKMAKIVIDPDSSSKSTDSVRDFVEEKDKAGELSELLPGFLSLTPVKPDFLTLTPERWTEMTPGERRDIRKGLQRRIDNLQAVYNNPDMWFSLHEDSDELEYVTPILIRLF